MAERLLLASIHDVGPRFEPQVDALVARLEGLLGEARFAMLVVSDHWDEAPLAADHRFKAKLRAWADAGIEMFVHGWRHRDDAAHSGLQALKGRHMTAGEGEFLGLDEEEAARRMARARRVVEDAIGRPAAGFIAPAWLYGDGARAALRHSGFALAEDHLRVWRPADERVLARGPVVTWASRSRARMASSLAAAAALRPLFPLISRLRIAVHPGDVGQPRLLASIDRTVQAALRTHRPGRYAELMNHR